MIQGSGSGPLTKGSRSRRTKTYGSYRSGYSTLIKRGNIFILVLPFRSFKLQKKPPEPQREKPALYNIIFLTFSFIFVGHYCPPGSGIVFPVLNPALYPQTQLIQDPNQTESGTSKPDRIRNNARNFRIGIP